jgi:hypothetical protein
MKQTFLVFLVAASPLFAQTIPIDSTYYGVQIHLGQLERTDIDSTGMEAILGKIQGAGFVSLRDECWWSETEKTRGVFTFPSSVDRLIRAVHRRGMNLLMILNYNNPLYAPHAGAAVKTDSNRQAYARYCQEVVKRYAPLGVKQYEIWNEPNIKIFWDPPNDSDYVELLKVAYPAIKAIDSSVTVLVGATSPSENNPPIDGFITWLPYLSGVFQRGGGNYCDAVSFHLYRVEKGPEAYLATDIANLQAIVGKSKPIWITEIGYHTSTVWPNLSTESQANFVSRLYLLGRAYPQLRRIVYYDFRNDGTSAADPEQNFGLVLNDLTPKPAYTALQKLTSTIGIKSLRNLTIAGTAYTMCFGDAGSHVTAVWSSSGPETRTISTGMINSVVDSRDGVRLSYVLGDSIATLPISTFPRYAVELSTLPTLRSLRISPKKIFLDTTQSISLTATGEALDGLPATVSGKGISWQYQGTGSVSVTNGVVRGSVTGQGKLMGTHNGGIDTVVVVIAPTSGSLLIDDFDNAKYWGLSFQNIDSAKSSVTISTDRATTGSTSGKLSYEYTIRSGIPSLNYRLYLNTDITVAGQPDSVYIDIWGNGQQNFLEYRFRDALGRYFSRYASDQPITWKDQWKTVRLSMKGLGTTIDYPLIIDRIGMVVRPTTSVIDSTYKETMYFDNFRAGYAITGIIDDRFDVPERIRLAQNYPNPFNATTRIMFSLPSGVAGAEASMRVFDMLGRNIRELWRGEAYPGEYAITFDASALPSGIYYYSLRCGLQSLTQRMILIK